MKPLIEKTWELICLGAKYICEENKEIEMDIEKERVYNTEFRSIHECVLKDMRDVNNPLDRHKIAAIIMMATIKTDMLKSSCTEGIFIGNYILATEVGLSYMLSELNEVLIEKKLPTIESFFFPEAISCETSYNRIFYRNLYFANTCDEWGLNPLDIAERLFLLEYMTLEKNGISPKFLKV